jgi:single-stranded DNA-binding protein
MACINRVILCGHVGKQGITVSYAPSGAPCAHFSLDLTETGTDGKPHSVYMDCECWGKRAEAASALEAGQLALFEGKLARRKKNEAWDWVISGFDLTPVVAPVVSMTGSSN